MKWYIISEYKPRSTRPYHLPKIRQALSRVLGLAIMFGAGYVGGQILRGIILGLLF